MAAHARYFLATAFRNQLAIEYPQATRGLLDTMATAASLASALALSTGRNVQILNIGSTVTDPKDLIDRRNLKILKGKAVTALRETGQFVCSKRRAKRNLHVNCALVEVLEIAEEKGLKDAFIVECMDDGQARVRWDGSMGEFMEAGRIGWTDVI
jgi:hypothetical protein